MLLGAQLDVKLSVHVYTMNKEEGVERQLHSFLTLQAIWRSMVIFSP